MEGVQERLGLMEPERDRDMSYDTPSEVIHNRYRP